MNRMQLAILSNAIYDALCEADMGSDLYSAVEDLVDRNQFYAIMAKLITDGKVVKRGQRYFERSLAPPEGVEVYGLDDPQELHDAIEKAVK